MIPCVFRSSHTGWKAERKIYEGLRKLNHQTQKRVVNYKKIFGFVYHGQTFNEEETDFVFVTNYGVIVVECKAVQKKNQAQSNFNFAHGQLKRKVEALVTSFGNLSIEIPIFKVVALPHLSRCDIEILDETRVFFKENLSDVEIWLRRFVFPEKSMTFQQYAEIALAFLIKYHSNGAAFVNGLEFKTRGIAHSSQKLDQHSANYYTKEQAVLLNIHHSENVWVTGAAGTGKTFVVKELVKRLSVCYPNDKDKKILVITYNVPINTDIKLFIEKETKGYGENVRVQTFSVLLQHILRAVTDDSELWNKIQTMKMEDDEKVNYILNENILKKYFKSKYTNTNKFRHILVDEAQDLPGNWLDLLDGLLNKTEKSNMWVFEDPFQVVRKDSNRPQKSQFTSYVLTKVFRNTHNIFEAYQHCYSSMREKVVSVEESQSSNPELVPPTIDHDVYGLSPEYITGENVGVLITTLKEWHHSKKVPYSDMAVITESAIEASNTRKVLEGNRIKAEDAETYLKNKNKGKGKAGLPVESYQRFKGLEAKVLIFYIPKGWAPQDVEIYVGFSRAYCHLIVIGPSRIINKLN